MTTINSSHSTTIDRLYVERKRVLRKLQTINRKFASFAGQMPALKPAKFQFYERVVILQDDPEIFGKIGSVLGRAQADDGTWLYAVFVHAANEAWDIAESNLESTGIVDKREDFYSGQSVRVRVSKAGRGTMVKTARRKKSAMR